MARVGSALSNYGSYAKPKPSSRSQFQGQAQQVRLTNKPARPMIDTAGWTAWRDAHQPPAAAAGTGAAGAAGTGSGLPLDPIYDQQAGGLQKRRDDTLSGLAGTRTRALLDYGYSAQYDANGNATGLTFDPNNPDSRAAQLKRRYNEAKAGTTNSMANRGQLYSGALLNAQDTNAGNYQRADNANQNALLAFLARNQGAKAGAGTDYELGMGQAAADRLGRVPPPPAPEPDAHPGSALSPEVWAKIDQWARQSRKKGRR